MRQRTYIIVRLALALLVVPATLAVAQPAGGGGGERKLAVTGGTGAGAYKAKAKVTVTADTPPAGKYFDRWSAGPASVKLRKPDHSAFVLEMPDADVALTAVYADLAASKLTRVACVGDSITEITGYPKALGDLLPKDKYEVRNFGVSSSTTLFKGPKPYYREPAFRAAKDYKPDVVVLLLGTNDTRKAQPNTYQHIADFVPNYRQIATELAGLESKPKVYLGLPTPMYGDGNWGLNEENLVAGVIPGIKQVADELKLPVIDLHAALSDKPEYFKDRVHPGGDGPKLMAATVYKALTGQEPPAPAPKPAAKPAQQKPAPAPQKPTTPAPSSGVTPPARPESDARLGTIVTPGQRTRSGLLRLDGADVGLRETAGAAEQRVPLASLARVTFSAPEANAPGNPPAAGSERPKPAPRKVAYPAVGGITAEYFADREMTDRRLARREENLLHAWPAGASPDPAVPPRFAARWVGQFKLPWYEQAKVRTLFVEADGGCRLWLDGVLRVDTWSTPPKDGTRASLELEAGRAYDFKLEYARDGSAAGHVRFMMTTIEREGIRALKGWYFTPAPGAAVPPTVAVRAPQDGDAVVGPLTIDAAAATAGDGRAIAAVRVYDNGALVGTIARPPYRAIVDRPSAGVHRLTAQAVDDQGMSAASTAVTVHVPAALAYEPGEGRATESWGVVTVRPPPDVKPLVNKRGAVDAEAQRARAARPAADDGPPAPAPATATQPATATPDATAATSLGTITLTAAGGDLRADADGFGGAFRDADGDFEFVARLDALSGAAADAQPMAGLTITSDLRPDSVRTSLVVAPSATGVGVLQLHRDRRKTPEWAEASAAKLPVWLRLVRAGRVVRTDVSGDGRAWTLVGQVQSSLPDRVRVGLVALTRDARSPVTATFGAVSVAPWRPAYESETAGVLLAGGSFLDAALVTLPGASLDGQSLRLRLPGRAEPVTIPRPRVARVLYRPVSADHAKAIPAGATGVVLANGDFLDGSIDSIANGQVTLRSVLFGRRTFRASSDLAAVVLGDAPDPARRPGTATVVRTDGGSRLAAASVRGEGGRVVVDEPDVGPISLPASAVREIRTDGPTTPR